MSRLARTWMAAAVALLPALAAAQEVTLEPSAGARCLSPRAAVEGGPEYPFVPFKREVGGMVKVELAFYRSDWRPEVKILAQEGPKDHVGEFVDAVKDHVRQFRVPCLRPEEGPARLVQEYVFVPARPQALGSEPVDPQIAERRQALSCVRHESGRKSPRYPLHARHNAIQGRVLARLRFDGADSPPAAEVYARPAARELQAEVEKWVRGYRMPCHTGGPITAVLEFKFVFEGEEYGFKPLTLKELLGSTLGIEKQTLALDTTTMNCPFDLHFTYRQPFLPNTVADLVNTRPAGQASAPAGPPGQDASRRPLLRWLEGVELKVGQRTLDAVFADTALLTVPCLKIDLKPKENS